MNTLGPYIMFSDARPAAWCYFKLDPSNTEKPIAFYTAPYTSEDNNITWSESPLEDKSPIYIYDNQEQKPCCYVIDANILYDIPQQKLGGQPHVNAMRHIGLKDHEITKHLANGKKARDYGVKAELYPEPGNLTETANHVPELPFNDSAATPYTTHARFISSDEAKTMLDVTSCIHAENQADCPDEIIKGCMYVWKTDETWSFSVNFLGTIKTGEFDKILDRAVIETLNTQPLGDITPEIDSIRLHLNRPYLNLTPHQQAVLVATMTPDWPLTEDISPDIQIQICRAIVEGSTLTEDTPENTQIKSDMNAFRPYLFPSTINRLYGHKALFTSTPAPTIADMIMFTDYLLMGAAQALGDKTSFTIPSPPQSSEVICGQLPGIENQATLIYQGLSEGQSELFQLIMRAEMQGMEAMPISDLMHMEPILHAVMEPSGQAHEFLELSNDLIASIAAQQVISQEEAKHRLQNTCERMIAQIHKTALIRLISIPQDEALQALQTSTHASLNGLVQCFFNSDEAAQANREAVVQHRDPDMMAGLLFKLYEADLLTGDGAQANLNTVVQHQDPNDVVLSLIRLHQAGLLTGDAAQDNRDAVARHQDRRAITLALLDFHQAGLHAGNAAQANRDAVVQSQRPLAVTHGLIKLHRAGLLTDDAAQDNRDAVVRHQDPQAVALALVDFHEAGLHIGGSAQANRDAVVQSPRPLGITHALIKLHRAGMLADNATQANRDAVIQSQHPGNVAMALIKLNSAGLLTGEASQANRDAVAQSPNPTETANTLIQNKIKADLDNLKPSSDDNQPSPRP